MVIISSSIFFKCSKHGLGHTYKVSAWNSHEIYMISAIHTHFERISSTACETLMKQPPGISLTAPSHYLNQCWRIISKVKWHSPKGKFTRYTSAVKYRNYLEDYVTKMSFKFPRGQWVDLTFSDISNIARGARTCFHHVVTLSWCDTCMVILRMWKILLSINLHYQKQDELMNDKYSTA